MEVILALWNRFFPDGVIYALTGIVFLVGLIKCCHPVFRSGRALRRATRQLRDAGKKSSRSRWNDPDFLGKSLQPVWRAFLQSAEMGSTSGVSSDVADYINDESVILEPGRASLAEVIPGLCTSFGILGTFIGLVMGLGGLDLTDITSSIQLTNGIAFAFYTSIVGLIASLLFNFIYRFGVGRATRALDRFVAAFYTYAIAQPPDVATQLLTYEREQADAMLQFAQDLSGRMGDEIHRGIASAMQPVQRSMDDFMKAATRAQVEGLDYIVARFVDRMNTMLGGELETLRTALSETSAGQLQAQEKLRVAVDSMERLTSGVVEVNQVSQGLVTKFSGYVEDMGKAYQSISVTQADAADMLEEIAEASARQAKYLSALQEYQAQLQGSFQEYTVWTDRFVGGLEERTTSQSASLERIAGDMRSSAEMLQRAYKSFTEAVELGLTNTITLVGENTQGTYRQMHAALKEIQETLSQLAPVAAAQLAPGMPHGQEVT